MKLRHKLREINACQEAIEWVADKDLKTAWAECERADWMLWLAEKLGVDQKLLVLVACDCAETVFEFLPKDNSVSRVAVTTARKWCDGEATIEEVIRAASRAARAARGADAVYAAICAAASYTAGAACAASRAACAAIDAAYAAACAATSRTACAACDAIDAVDVAYTGRAANGCNNKALTELVRQRIPFSVIEKALKDNTNG